jgi:hypothetical protein
LKFEAAVCVQHLVECSVWRLRGSVDGIPFSAVVGVQYRVWLLQNNLRAGRWSSAGRGIPCQFDGSQFAAAGASQGSSRRCTSSCPWRPLQIVCKIGVQSAASSWRPAPESPGCLELRGAHLIARGFWPDESRKLEGCRLLVSDRASCPSLAVRAVRSRCPSVGVHAFGARVDLAMCTRTSWPLSPSAWACQPSATPS